MKQKKEYIAFHNMTSHYSWMKLNVNEHNQFNPMNVYLNQHGTYLSGLYTSCISWSGQYKLNSYHNSISQRSLSGMCKKWLYQYC